MKKLIFLIGFLFVFIFGYSQTKVIRPYVNANLLNWQLSTYYLDTTSTSQDKNGQLTLNTLVTDSIYVFGKSMFDSTVSIGGWGYTGEHIILPESSSNTNAGLGLYSMLNSAASAGKVFAGTYSRMLLMTTNQTNQSTMVGAETQFRLRDVDIADGVHAGLWAYAEQSGTSTLSGGGTFDAISATVESASTFTVGATEHVTGITIDGSINASATIDGSANFSGLYIKSNGKDWFDGIKVTGSETGINVGTAATGLDFTGTYTGNVIDLSNITIDYTGSNGPAPIRIGTYGSPLMNANEDQSGLLRLYSQTSANGTSYDRGIFVAQKTSGTKGVMPIAGLAEILAQSGNGPTNVHAGEFITNLITSTSKLADGGVDAWAGNAGIWAKITSATGSTTAAGSISAPIWADNQMNGTVNGEEYAFYITSSTKPDAVFGFEASSGSGGWDQLFYFDETTYDKVPIANTSLKVLLNTTQYYIPLSTSSTSFVYDSIDANYIDVDTIILNEFMNPDDSLGAYIGTEDLPFSHIWGDSIFSKFMGQTITTTADEYHNHIVSEWTAGADMAAGGSNGIYSISNPVEDVQNAYALRGRMDLRDASATVDVNQLHSVDALVNFNTSHVYDVVDNLSVFGAAVHGAGADITNVGGDGSLNLFYGAWGSTATQNFTIPTNGLLLMTHAGTYMDYGVQVQNSGAATAGLYLKNHASNSPATMTSGILMESAAGNMTYGVNMTGAGITTADLLLSNGATLFNSDANTVSLSVNSVEAARFVESTTTQLLVGNGTAALPSVSFISDPNTGLYSGGADAISIALGGAIKYEFSGTRFKASGNTGFYLLRAGVSSTVPVLISRANDLNTGIGSAGADLLSHIAGGKEGIRIDGLLGGIEIYMRDTTIFDNGAYLSNEETDTFKITEDVIKIEGDLHVTGNVTQSHYGGMSYISTPGTQTIGTGGTFEKLYEGAMAYTSGHLDKFTESNGRLTYTGAVTKHFQILVFAGLEGDEAAQLIQISIAKGGVIIAATSKGNDFTAADSKDDLATGWLLELAQNEYIEVYGTSDQDNDIFEVQTLQIIISQMD